MGAFKEKLKKIQEAQTESLPKNGKDGYTPIKGVDYFDGEKGEKGDPGEFDLMAAVEEIMRLPEDKFSIKASQVSGLQQTFLAFQKQLKGGYLHGGGDTVAAGTGITITNNANGTKTISSTAVGGVSSVFGRTGAVTAQSGDYNTSQVTENTNLYYTQARFDSAFSAKSTSNLSEGINLYFTNARAIAATLTGYISGAGTISAADSILSAIQKLNGNIGALVTGVSSVSNSDGTLTISPNTGAVIASRAAITGDVAVAGGSNVSVLATVNSNVGSFGSATQSVQITVNAKGLITAVSNTSIQITESQVTNLTTDLSNKQPLATNLTSLAALSFVSTSFVKMTSAGTFALDTNTYLTGNQTITLSGAVTGSGTTTITATFATPGTLSVSSTNSNVNAHTHAITSSSAPGAAASLLATDASGIIGSTGTRIVKIWATDLTVTNNIAGSITGNAATVTTNANLTGPITSVGNATSIASQTGTGTTFAMQTSPAFLTSISTPSIITASGALGITPAAGSNLNVTLSTTGDFAVNTSQLYVDTSSARVGIGQTAPNCALHIGAGTDADITGFQMIVNQNGNARFGARDSVNDIEFGGGTNSIPAQVFFGSRTNHDFGIQANQTNFLWLMAVGNLKLGNSTAVRGTTEGTMHFDIFNGTAPAGTLASGFSLFGTAGIPRIMDNVGTDMTVSGSLFAQTADKSVTNTLTETSIVGTGTGSLTLPANFWTVGRTVRITMSGVYSTVAVTGDTITIKVKYGSTVLGSVSTTSLLAGASSLYWWADALITCRSIGATGTVQISGGITYNITTAGGLAEDAINNGAATTTIDTTASALLDISVTHSAANASNTVKSLVGSFKVD